MYMSKKAVTVSSKIPATLEEAMNEFIIRDTHLNQSEFIRVAIREKVQRDAPHLIKEMLKPSKK